MILLTAAASKLKTTIKFLSLFLVFLIPAIGAAQKPELVTQTGHTSFGRIDSVAFSTDGKLTASLGPDETIKLWSVNEGYELRTIVLKGRISLNVSRERYQPGLFTRRQNSGCWRQRRHNMVSGCRQ